MKYELRGKIPKNSSIIFSEDVLTSNTFGYLDYIDSQAILKDFLEKSIDENQNYLKFTDSSKFQIYFWPKHYLKTRNSYSEPDLMLISEQIVLIIECKYYSNIYDESLSVDSNITYSNQLIRYSEIFSNDLYKQKEKIMIYLSNETTLPLELMRKTKLPKGIELFWLSWNKLFTSIPRTLGTEYHKSEIKILTELKSFLDKRNLREFEGFHIRKNQNTWHFKKKTSYSFNEHVRNFTWKYIK